MAIANNLIKIRAFILFFDLIMSIEKASQSDLGSCVISLCNIYSI